MIGWPGLAQSLDPNARYAGTYDPQGNYHPLQANGRAQDMEASILASEFANWEKQFKPVELNLLNQSSLNNPNIMTNAVDSATVNTNQTFDALQDVQSRQLAAKGIAVTPQQQTTMTRLNGLSRAAAVAGAQNQTRRNIAAQDEMIALGSTPSFTTITGGTQ